MSITIPTYGADGQRLRSYSLCAIEALLSEDAIVVQRNRKGHIVCARFRERCLAETIGHAAYLGQHYSFAELLPSGRHAWRHSPLLQRADKKDLMREGFNSKQADLFVCGIFRGVVLSCLQRPARKAASGKVVSIDSARKHRSAVNSRPVEFDSENRRAA